MLGYFVQIMGPVNACVILIVQNGLTVRGSAYVVDGLQNRDFFLNVGTARVLRNAETDAIHDLDSELHFGSAVDRHLDLGERSSI